MRVQRTSGLVALMVITAVLVGVPAAADASPARHTQAALQRRALTALHMIVASRPCRARCRAAYFAVAAALPGDRTNVVTRAVLSTPNIDYHRLTVTLGAPTIPEIKAEWLAMCKRWFPGSSSLQLRCYQLILGPQADR